MLDGGSCSCHSRASATPVLPPFHASLASFLQLRLTPRMRCALHNLLASCVAYASYGGGPLVSCLGGLFASPPRIASDPGSRCYLFEIFCGRRRDGRRCDEQTGGGGGSSQGVDGAVRGAALGVASGHAAAVCVRRWRGARPQTRRRVICLSAHASYVCRLYFIHTYVYVDCSVCPARLRRSDGSTCCVGRTTTAPRFCFRLLWEF